MYIKLTQNSFSNTVKKESINTTWSLRCVLRLKWKCGKAVKSERIKMLSRLTLNDARSYSGDNDHAVSQFVS